MSSAGLVLGVSMSNHDRAACLLRDGRLVSAVAEERLDRRKGSEGFLRSGSGPDTVPPLRAITAVLHAGGVRLDDVDLVVCGRSVLRAKDALTAQLPVDPAKVHEPPFPSHHVAHGYAAYATSPFEAPAVLVIDEKGERDADGRYEKATWFQADGDRLRALRRFWCSDSDLSLGMLYNAFAALVGLSEAGRPAAGKLMALAAGSPREPVGLGAMLPDGDFQFPLERLVAYLDGAGLPLRRGARPAADVRGIDDLAERFVPVHWRTTLAAELAAVAQAELRAAVLHTAGALRRESGRPELAYGGGVALNCSANRLLRTVGWDDVFVHPAATDDGNAAGLAWYGWHEVLGGRRAGAGRFVPLTGPSYPPPAVNEALTAYGLGEYGATASVTEVAELLRAGDIVCRVSGRSEWGPRALGARSILVDPTRPGVRDRLNGRVKFREPFRPFGLSLTAECAPDVLLVDDVPGSLLPYMLTAVRFTAAWRDRLREVTHVDGTVRPQVVARADMPEYWSQLQAFGELSGVPALLNTSFNTLGEPLVETPGDAVRQFLLSGADALHADGVLVRRADVPPDALDRARRSALRQSRIDPVAAALSVQAAGHGQAAVDLLRWATRGAPDDGPVVDARLLRLPIDQLGDGVTELATRVLERYSAPSDVVRAARALRDAAVDEDRVARYLLGGFDEEQDGSNVLLEVLTGGR